MSNGASNNTTLIVAGSAAALGAWYLADKYEPKIGLPPFLFGLGAKLGLGPSTSPTTSPTTTPTPTHTATSGLQKFTLPVALSNNQIASAAGVTPRALDAVNLGPHYQYFRKHPARAVKAGTTITLPKGANLKRLQASAQAQILLNAHRIAGA